MLEMLLALLLGLLCLALLLHVVALENCPLLVHVLLLPALLLLLLLLLRALEAGALPPTLPMPLGPAEWLAAAVPAVLALAQPDSSQRQQPMPPAWLQLCACWPCFAPSAPALWWMSATWCCTP